MPHPLISFEYVVQNIMEDEDEEDNVVMARQQQQHQQQQWLDYSNEQFRQQQQQQQRRQIPMASEAEAFHPQMYKVVPRDSVQQR